MKSKGLLYVTLLLGFSLGYLVLGGQEGCETCTDNDGDGYAVEGGSCGPVDCDDTEPLTNPGTGMDLPDPEYIDANCDGIDGDVIDAVFVSKGGSNESEACSMAEPCQTIGRGVEAAAESWVTQILVQRGIYEEIVDLNFEFSDLGIYGGYDESWERGHHREPDYETIVIGGLHPEDSQYMTVRARSVARFVFGNIDLVGPDASLQEAGHGLSSYVVHALSGIDLIFTNVTFTQGDAADGEAGIPATDASALPPSAGEAGGHGWSADPGDLCADEPGPPGGSGAQNADCPIGTRGGNGGSGGRMDTCCADLYGVEMCTLCDCSATAGVNGSNAEITSPGYGSGGNSGYPCGTGASGQNGSVGTDGDGGAGAPGGGMFLSGLWWFGRDGSDGGVATNGTGGGGGGGGGGCDDGYDTTGSGGGAGGAGGCAPTDSGRGGKGGGGSYGIFAVDSTIQAIESLFLGGDGGQGGDGGNGGLGQPGSEGGPHGDGPGDAGGHGGNGERGGHSGGGGGGAGGVSYGIYLVDSSLFNTFNTFEEGLAGTGGSGGLSPGGSDGIEGASGVTGDVGSFVP